MSTFSVSCEHVRVLVWAGRCAASYGPRQLCWYDGAQRYHRHDPAIHEWVGQMLWDQNARSVSHGHAAADIRPYVNRPPRRDYLPVEVLKALQSYEYQSCETEDWEQTDAYHYCEALRHYLINRLPGYRAAEWAI